MIESSHHEKIPIAGAQKVVLGAFTFLQPGIEVPEKGLVNLLKEEAKCPDSNKAVSFLARMVTRGLIKMTLYSTQASYSLPSEENAQISLPKHIRSMTANPTLN